MNFIKISSKEAIKSLISKDLSIHEKGVQNFYNFCQAYNIAEVCLRKATWVHLSTKFNKRFMNFTRPFVLYDHPQLFKTYGGKHVLVLQPYDICEIAKYELEEFCSSRFIHVTYYSKSSSWYYPNRTEVIILEIADELKFEELVKNYMKKMHSNKNHNLCIV